MGVHKICGLVESFSANYTCRICKVKKECLRSQTIEVESLLRAIHDYEDDLEGNVSNTGINDYCIWNDLPSFHIFTNTYLDLMHDFWEGVCPYDLSGIILHYIRNKFFTLEDINDRILGFNYGSIKQNKVPFLKKDKLKNGKLGFSASETKTFVKYLGLMIGDLIPVNDEHWNLLIYLQKINDLLSSRFFNKNCLALLKILISDHHKLYISLFGETLKPKHYFLLHYPQMIENVGPCKNLCCMRTEAKHRPSKIAAHLSNSSVNLPLTVAIKHQYQQCYDFMCQDSLIFLIESGATQTPYDEKLMNFREYLSSDFLNDSGVNSPSWLRIDNITYKPYMVLAISTDDHIMPNFAQILKILINSEQKCLFITKKFKTLGFCSHVNAYEILLTNDLVSVYIDDIFSKFPTCIQNAADGRYFIVYNECH